MEPKYNGKMDNRSIASTWLDGVEKRHSVNKQQQTRQVDKQRATR